MTKISNKGKVKRMMESVCDFLQQKYGTIQPEWEPVLMVLSDTLSRYYEVKESIDNNGIINTGGFKNQLLSTEKDLIATILKLSQKLGVSPWDASKINVVEEDNTEDFIESLTNG